LNVEADVVLLRGLVLAVLLAWRTETKVSSCEKRVLKGKNPGAPIAGFRNSKLASYN